MIVEHRYRTFWQRFAANAVDGFLIYPFLLSFLTIVQLSDTVAIRVAAYLASLLCFFAYSVIFHGIFGQTVGKRLFGIKVVDVSEFKLSFVQALRRDSPAIPPLVYQATLMLPILLRGDALDVQRQLESSDWLFLGAILMNFIWAALEIATMLTNSKRRALHDVIAGSVVVRVQIPTEKSRLRAPVLDRYGDVMGPTHSGPAQISAPRFWAVACVAFLFPPIFGVHLSSNWLLGATAPAATYAAAVNEAIDQNCDSSATGEIIPALRVPPQFPPLAEYMVVEGWATLEFSVSAEGHVQDARIVDANHSFLFDRASLSAVQHWRYCASSEGATGVKVTLEYSFPD